MAENIELFKWNTTALDFQELKKLIPKKLIKEMYDKDDNVLFGSRYVKGKVTYQYLPGEYTVSGIPFIIGVSIAYDGIGNSNLPKDARLIDYDELHTIFTENQFG